MEPSEASSFVEHSPLPKLEEHSDGLRRILSSSVLPARREQVTIETHDGLRLVGELALPLGRVRDTLVTLHPLPTQGGSMDSHLLRKASYRLPALTGTAILRFNTRGTASALGKSDGKFSEGIEEATDIDAACRWVAHRGLPRPWLLGWSFGTELALKYGPTAAGKALSRGAILLSPPLHRATDADLDRWAASQQPLTALIPEYDDFLQPAEALRRFSRVPQAQVIAIAGAKHLWVGEKFVVRALTEVVSTMRGQAVTLPDTWDGPMERGSVNHASRHGKG